ncbi:MAG: hypothetical protein AAF901_09940, partial [Bacteroidota bacterium]
KGSQADTINRFYMPYNNETNSYELEIEITLERLGSYSFFSSDSIEFIGGGCNRFVLDTNVQWNYTNGKIEFTVVE